MLSLASHHTVEFVHVLIFTISSVEGINNSDAVPQYSPAQQPEQLQSEEKDALRANDHSRRVNSVGAPIMANMVSTKQTDGKYITAQKVPEVSMTEVLMQQNTYSEAQAKAIVESQHSHRPRFR